jgi:signal peptidase I
LGWYVPKGRMLPLGDNRDNSRDGRYFGPVPETKILGQAVFKYNLDLQKLDFNAGLIP